MVKQRAITKSKGNDTTRETLCAPLGGEASAPATTITSGTSSFTDAGLISNGRALTILGNVLGPLMPKSEFPVRTTLADTEYLETDPQFVISTIVTDPILSAQSYHADIFDCDDYALYLKTKCSLYAASNRLPAPLAVGYLFTTKHAFNFCLAAGSALFLINTQSEAHAVTGDPATFGRFLSIGPGNGIAAIYL